LERGEPRVVAGVVVGDAVPNTEDLRRRQLHAAAHEALWEDDPRMNFFAGDGIAHRLELELDGIAGTEPCSMFCELQLVRHGLRVGERVRAREDLPRPARLAAEQRRQRVPLRVVPELVDERDRDTASFVDRPGPVCLQREVEPVELYLTEAPLADMPRPAALTVSVSRRCVEVARTSVRAVARD